MPWVKLDDQYPIHRKVAGLSDAAFRLDIEGFCWCARNLTDGHIRRTELESVSNAPRTSRKWRANLERSAAELVDSERWHSRGHDCRTCPEPIDGWVIHDYLSYQPPRAKVLRERAGKNERQRRWMDRVRGKGDASTPRERDASTGRSGDASTDALETPAPYPPRPEGSGAVRPEHPPPAAQRQGAGGGGRENPSIRHPSSRAPQCRRHRGQPAHNCAPCRSEQLATKDDR